MGSERSKQSATRNYIPGNGNARRTNNKNGKKAGEQVHTKTRFKLCYSFLNCDNSQILKQRTKKVRKAGELLIKYRRVNYGSNVHTQIYIFFSLGLGILSHQGPDTPEGCFSAAEVLEIQTYVTNLTEVKIYNMGKLKVSHKVSVRWKPFPQPSSHLQRRKRGEVSHVQLTDLGSKFR